MKTFLEIKAAIHLRLFRLLPRVFGHLYPIYQHDYINYQNGNRVFNSYHNGMNLEYGLEYGWKPEIHDFLESCQGYEMGKQYDVKPSSSEEIKISGHARDCFAIVYPLYFISMHDLICFKLAFSGDDKGPVYDKITYIG